MNQTPTPNPLSPDHLRTLEALLFAAENPLSMRELAAWLPEDADIPALLAQLQAQYDTRGINLVQRGEHWLFQTAPDLAYVLRRDVEGQRKPGRAMVETLAIIAYHQYDLTDGRKFKGVTRAEIEDIRGVAISRGTLDTLMAADWVRPVGRREVPGRPVIYGTTPAFLVHFGLKDISDLPGLLDLKALGMLDPLGKPAITHSTDSILGEME